MVYPVVYRKNRENEIANHFNAIVEIFRFPPQDLVAPLDSKCLPYPVVTDPEAPPLRPQRHVPNSIATLHRRAVYAIGQALLPRCPACARNFPQNLRRNL
jgi:hypothetical protein